MVRCGNMADNLSIAVTADTTSLRAQLALAAADVRAYGAEVRQTATALRSAGNDNSLLAQLNAQAASLNRATAELGRYKNEIRAALSAAGKESQSFSTTMLDSFGALKGALAGMGALFAV